MLSLLLFVVVCYVLCDVRCRFLFLLSIVVECWLFVVGCCVLLNMRCLSCVACCLFVVLLLGAGCCSL